MSNKVEQQLTDAQIVIDNALNNPSIRKQLESYGYDVKRIKAGKELREKAMMLHSAQKKEYGVQYGATDALLAARQEAATLYKKHLTLARMALPGNRGAWNTLQLNGARKRNFAGWVSQARVFYTNVLDIAAELETFGVTQAELETGQAMIEAVADARARQQQGKSKAQQTTRQRNEALQALNQWMDDFMTVARIALRESPQELEALGVVM